MSKILISYRREDSADVVGRIYDRLIDEFDRASVFMDVDSIPLGVDFRTYLDEQVAKCHVFLAVIGQDWMKARGGKGKSRLEDPRDFVRIEIESALKRGIPVIPVLVRGGSIPAAGRLPGSMQDFAYRNGIAVRPDPDFHRDMDRLIEYLKKQIQLFQGHRAEEHNAVKSAGEDMQIAESIKPRAEPPSPRASAGMVKVPKGPFLYGEDKHREAIDYDYWIGIYPVTNKEFGAFISAHGYQNQAYWSQEGWKWRTDNNIQSPDRDYWKDANGTSSIILWSASAITKLKPMRNG